MRWEAFLIQAVGEALYVVGTDRRGTVFGIYDLCEAMGVSPWYWFGDVPVRNRPEVRFRAETRHADWPGVAYRGIFINDEEELERWAQEHTGDDTIGPETYARLFELVLRLKGNYDTGFSTAAIDGDDSLTEVGRHRARVDLLGRVIADQRRLLIDELGDRGRDCLQLFIPYKEVLPLYDGGLELPDDVTVVWANDNFGYVRRYPTGAELDRPGGHGLYYHSSYWSVPPGRSSSAPVG